MRRLVAILVLAPVLAATGCDGDDGASGPLDAALRYLPADSPFVAAIDTDVDGGQYQALDALVRKFPFGEQAAGALERELEQQGDGVDFDRDVKPVLGNPFVVGAVDARSFVDGAGDDRFVGAVQAADGDKLQDLVERAKSKKVGEEGGATLYEDNDGDVFAVEDDALVVGGTRGLVEQAVARRDGDEHLDEGGFEEALEGLPEDALVRTFFDLEALLRADPDAEQARKIRWVAALRTLGLTAAAKRDSIAIDFNVRTAPGRLDDGDLPIAAGQDAPAIVERQGEIAIGLRDPGQILDFALQAGRAVEPAAVAAGQRQIERQLGIDIERDLLEQLRGDATVTLTVSGDYGLRAKPKDPAAFERTLAKVADELPQIAGSLGGGRYEIARRGDFYALTGPGGETIVFGVVDEVFVVSNDPRRAARLAKESPREVPGAEGSIVLSADAQKLADQALRSLAPELGGLGNLLGGRLFTEPLGDVVGSVSADTDGLDGHLSLEVD
jgi:hypothetical protein